MNRLFESKHPLFEPLGLKFKKNCPWFNIRTLEILSIKFFISNIFCFADLVDGDVDGLHQHAQRRVLPRDCHEPKNFGIKV